MSNAQPLTADEVQATVIDAVSHQIQRDPSEITAESHLTADLGMDSLDVVELQMELEDRFGITIPDEDVEKISTVGLITAYVAGQAKP